MNWTNAPIGMTRSDELLDILTSLDFTLHRANRGGNPDYVAGFADALNAVAMSAGLGNYFKPTPVIVEPVNRLESGGR